ncbi:MAG: hypothetical protein K1X52_09110 [Pyrinomonadaceae bacterium]|nr:hypothetical protein [Pyrinomonadaceae bacterium]
MKCLACGREAVVSGTIVDLAAGGEPAFNLDDASGWRSWFGSGTRKIRGYACVNCQHLQLAVDFSDKDREKYQQFEGQQPNVLERINSERELPGE